MLPRSGTVAPENAQLRQRAVSKEDSDIIPLVLIVGALFLAGVVRRIVTAKRDQGA